jgi:anti-sigma factor RsiW
VTRDCSDLDAYLADDLEAEAREQFEMHVTTCTRCRHSVHQQNWMDRLLRSAVVECEVPPLLWERVLQRSIARPRRHLWLVSGGLAAAVIAMLAVGGTAMFHRPPISPEVVGRMDPETAPPDEPVIAETPRAKFHGGPELIVVPVESRYPNVSIFQVYTAYRPDDSVHAPDQSPERAQELSWPEPLN